MKEKIGIILATTTIITGCDQDWSNVLENSLRTEIEVPADALSPDLPPAVAAQIPNAVAILNNVQHPNGRIDRSACSGVRIDDNFYLTSGHCDTPIAIGEEKCQEFTISSPGPITVEAFGKAARIPEYMTDGDTVKSDAEDIMLLQSATEVSSPDTQVYNSPADTKLGTRLYSINFQPTTDERRRNPDAETLFDDEKASSINTPAIVGMIAVHKLHDQTLLALTTNQSYGETLDTTVRDGASGSPIYDDKGILIGVMNGTADTVQTVGDFEESTRQDITNLPADTPAQLITIKTVTADIVEQLQSEEQHIAQCDY